MDGSKRQSWGSEAADATGPARRIIVWDLPVRVFHWAVVALIGFSWWAAEHDRLDLHKLSGYAILTLVLFRVFWGVAGSATARFSSFVRGPREVLAYARHFFSREPSHWIGHNPMGALSVLGLLALLLVQTATGLCASDEDGLESGPLARLVGYDMSRTLSKVHGTTFTLIQVLVVLHVAVILFYAFYKREDLIGPMVRGSKTISREKAAAGAAPPQAPLGLALVLLIAAAAAVWAIVALLPRL
ncbi:MAG TPA: cytochrome b/b6 domain-containing protein [Stellaceae bacterium]|jgi:cytochrome b